MEGHEGIQTPEQLRQHIDGIGAAGTGHLQHHDDDGGGQAHVVQRVDQRIVHGGEVQGTHAAAQHEQSGLRRLHAHEVQAAEGRHQCLSHGHTEIGQKASEVALDAAALPELRLRHRDLHHHRGQQAAYEQRQHHVIRRHGGAVVPDLIDDMRVHLHGGGQILRHAVGVALHQLHESLKGGAVRHAADVRLHIGQITGDTLRQRSAGGKRGLC